MDPQPEVHIYQEDVEDLIKHICNVPCGSPTVEDEIDKYDVYMGDISTIELADLLCSERMKPSEAEDEIASVTEESRSMASSECTPQQGSDYTVEDINLWLRDQKEMPNFYPHGPPSSPPCPPFTPPRPQFTPPRPLFSPPRPLFTLSPASSSISLPRALFSPSPPPSPVFPSASSGAVTPGDRVTEENAPPQQGSSAWTSNQGQSLRSHTPTNTIPRPTVDPLPDAAPPNPFGNLPVVDCQQFANHKLVPIGVVNGEVIHVLVPVNAYPGAAAAATDVSGCTSNSKKRKRDDGGQPYVKKPLNAFMMYMKHQRSSVAAEINIKESAVVNRVLGQRWNEMPAEQQAMYYELAKQDADRHNESHPEWTGASNYGQKRKRVRAGRQNNGQGGY